MQPVEWENYCWKCISTQNLFSATWTYIKFWHSPIKHRSYQVLWLHNIWENSPKKIVLCTWLYITGNSLTTTKKNSKVVSGSHVSLLFLWTVFYKYKLKKNIFLLFLLSYGLKHLSTFGRTPKSCGNTQLLACKDTMYLGKNL